MDHAFVLLKPDALSHVGWKEYICNQLANLQISITSSFKGVLKRDDIRESWITAPNILEILGELEGFLGNKEIEVLVLEGEDLFYKLWKLKKELRSSFPCDHVRNLVHVPDNEIACERELRVLNGVRTN